MLRRFVWKALSAFLVSMTLSSAVLANEFDHSDWGALLQSHVRLDANGHASTVDYAGFKRQRTALGNYLSSLEQVSQSTFDTWPKAEQLAFLINAYNAWTIELVLTGYPKIESIKDLGSFFSSPWSKEIAPLLGETRSLDDIEHGLIRGSGRYNEPRIHFAVNCASIGCPALLPEAFSGAALEDQLDRATRGFLSDKSRNRFIDDRLEVSSIFKWYRDDFEVAPYGSLAAYLLTYADELGADKSTSKKVSIRFLNYDWKLNSSE